MFGLSKEEVLVKAIKNACVNLLPQYETSIDPIIAEMASGKEYDDDELKNRMWPLRIDYLDAVCDSISNGYKVSSPAIAARFQLALMSPAMTGLPSEFNIDYFCENGISAGLVFGLAYFALSNKKVDNPKFYRTMSMLNHFQTDLMNESLGKVAAKYNLE